MSYANRQVFTPRGTVRLSATTSTTRANLPAISSEVPDNIMLFNAGTATAYVQVGNASVVATVPTATSTTATPGSFPVPPGFYPFAITRAPSQEYIAAITASGTADLYAFNGTGT